MAGSYHRFRDISGRPEVFGGVSKTHPSKLTLRRNEQERSVMKHALGVSFPCLFKMESINVFNYVSNWTICITLLERRGKNPSNLALLEITTTGILMTNLAELIMCKKEWR